MVTLTTYKESPTLVLCAIHDSLNHANDLMTIRYKSACLDVSRKGDAQTHTTYLVLCTGMKQIFSIISDV